MDAIHDRGEFNDDPVRRRSPEWDYGVHWKRSDDGPEWPRYRVSWIVETGELYATPNAGEGDVLVLAVIPRIGDYPYGEHEKWRAFNAAQTVERMLDGWADEPRSLDWIRRRIAREDS